MRVIAVLLLLCGCAGNVVDDPGPGTGGGAPEPTPGVPCPLPNVGSAPRACVTSVDCAWSTCSESRCVDGACVHDTVKDGSACFLDVDLYVGTCESCMCVIET
jgi:hypothetical protein